MVGQERLHFGSEREGLDPHVIHGATHLFQNIESFADCRVTTTNGDHANLRPRPFLNHWCRNIESGFLVLEQEPVHDFLVLIRDLGIATELVMAGTTGEERALRVNPRQRPCRNCRTFFRQVPEEFVHLLQLFRCQYFAAVRNVSIVPLQLRRHPVVHADIEVGQQEYRRLEPLRQIEAFRGHFKAFCRTGGE